MRVRMIPPIWLLLALIAMSALHRYFPLVQIFDMPYRTLGAIPVIAGILLAAIAAAEFSKADTPIRPFEDTTALVTTGPFRKSRNPMYLGMVLTVCGVAVLLGSLSPWLVLPVFVWVIQTRFINEEERILAAQFPQDYPAYRDKVRRWF